jgi:hypothetical protein
MHASTRHRYTYLPRTIGIVQSWHLDSIESTTALTLPLVLLWMVSPLQYPLKLRESSMFESMAIDPNLSELCPSGVVSAPEMRLGKMA